MPKNLDCPNCQELTAKLAEATWKCKAQPTADPPQDCGWPDCGCDPNIDKVMGGLLEIGWLGREEAKKLTAERDELTRRLTELESLPTEWEGFVKLYWERVEDIKELRCLLSDSPCGKGHPMKFWVQNTNDKGDDDLIGQTSFCQICRQIQESEGKNR
jgi:hypothetical protein